MVVGSMVVVKTEISNSQSLRIWMVLVKEERDAFVGRSINHSNLVIIHVRNHAGRYACARPAPSELRENRKKIGEFVAKAQRLYGVLVNSLSRIRIPKTFIGYWPRKAKAGQSTTDVRLSGGESVDSPAFLNMEDEVKIILISFVKENKKKQKEKTKKDAECTSNSRPSDTEPGQSLLKACSSGPEHDDHREEDLRRSEHVATKEEVMAVMEGSYRERSGGGSLVGVISCLTWTWRRSRWCCCGEGEANQTADESVTMDIRRRKGRGTKTKRIGIIDKYHTLETQ
ncbi:hypothetical protein YC2023_102448 [Brassica napus]